MGCWFICASNRGEVVIVEVFDAVGFGGRGGVTVQIDFAASKCIGTAEGFLRGTNAYDVNVRLLEC